MAANFVQVGSFTINLVNVLEVKRRGDKLVFHMVGNVPVALDWIHVGRLSDTADVQMERIDNMLRGKPLPDFCVSIFGFAGCVPEDAPSDVLNSAFYDRMVAEVHLKNMPLGRTATLGAGCATWADHIAVTIFLSRPRGTPMSLTLYPPCNWDAFDNVFVAHTLASTGGDAKLVFKSAEAATKLNEEHAAFSEVLGRDTLAEIGAALKRGAQIDVSNVGFIARDHSVAEHALDVAVAFAWSHTDKPNPGGTTKYTWDLCPETTSKCFVSLYDV